MRGPTPLLLIVAMVAACTSSGAPPPASAGRPATSSPATSPDVPDPTASTAATASEVGGGPPAGRLRAEGGDAVTGQLGSYIWGDGGSDSPWLPGAFIAVGAGEPLSVSFDPAVEVASWRARYVPSSADGPDGATALGEGPAEPAFTAPSAGSWTVEVHVTFAAELGDANYFWRLEIT
jgi:hypothetical protein